MIAIVDYGMGNVASIQKMLKRVGVESILSNDPKVVQTADKLILPGVGAFDSGMEHLATGGLREVLDEAALNNKKPILGICLGMQLLLDRSEEGDQPGLGWISGDVVRFEFDDPKSRLKVPHMGWNFVKPHTDCSLFRELDDPRYYFVHSYYVVPKENAHIAATAQYGFEFCCSVSKENIFGVQFHPEKSHRYGLKLLENFASL